MAEGSMNRNHGALLTPLGDQKASKAQPTPQVPSLSGFSFRSIGKQPELLKRIHDPVSHENGRGEHHYSSSSSSPDLEHQLLPPEDDSDGRYQSQSKRNRLLESLAPDADIDMDDMYADEDDVRPPVGVSLGPKEAQTASASCTTTLNSQLQLKPTSGGKLNCTSNQSAPAQAPSGSGSLMNAENVEKHASSSTQQGHFPHVGSAGCNGKSSVAPSSHHSHPIPPTPPPENDPSPQTNGQNPITHYDSLRATRLRLQSLAEFDAADFEDFNEIRELAQAAKVESTAISCATQKAATLAQKALAMAQESMQASQECVETARAAKRRWEVAIQGCEKFMEERLAKRLKQQDAIKDELVTLGESIRLLEEEDRRRVRRARAEALERNKAEATAARALKHTATSASSALPNPASIPPLLEPSAAAGPLEDREHATSATMLALAEKVRETNRDLEQLQKEMAELRKLSDNRKAEAFQGAQGRRKEKTRQEKVEPTKEHGRDAVEHLRKESAEAKEGNGEKLHANGQSPDPQLLEQVLRNKLKSHKDLNRSISSTSSRMSSSDPSSGTQAQSLNRDPGHNHASSAITRNKQSSASTAVSAISVKTECQEDRLPEQPHNHVVQSLPPPNSAFPNRADSMQLEYPPMLDSLMNTNGKQPKHVRPPGRAPAKLSLACLGASIERTTVKPNQTAQPDEDSDDSPVTLHRQGSDPGNLPIMFPELNHSCVPPNSMAQDSTAESSSLCDQVSVKEEYGEIHIDFQPATQQMAPALVSTTVMHPPNTTLPELSPINTSVFSTSSPDVVNQPAKSKKNKGKAQRQQQNQFPVGISTPVVVPPASAQLPPKPLPIAATHTIVQSKPIQSTAGGTSHINGTEAVPAAAQHNVRGPSGGGVTRGGLRRTGPPLTTTRQPVADPNRRYIPARSRSQSCDRSRTPPRRSRDQAHREYDHYSPPRSRSRNGSMSRRGRSPQPLRLVRSPPRRVMHPYRRSPEFSSAPSTSLAGTKRPMEDPATVGPVSIRRRAEDTSAQITPPPPPLPQQVDPNSRAGERLTEDWSMTANYHVSPSSSSGISLGSQVSAVNHAPQQQHQVADDDRGPPQLASRLSDAHHITGSSSVLPTQPRQHNEPNGRNSNPPSRWGSQAPEESSRPVLLDRFSRGPPPSQPSRGSARGDPRASRGRGRGRGGGAVGHHAHGQSQPLNNRISSGNPHGSLLERIQD